MKRPFSRPSNGGFHDAGIKDHAAENGCDSTCDITAALRAGYPRVAAYLLAGATEAPTVALVARSAGEDFGGSSIPLQVAGLELSEIGAGLAAPDGRLR